MKYKFYILLFIITTSCGISEDCFKGSGNKISQSFPLEGFTKLKVHEGVGLIIKEGPSYEVTIETSDNIIDNIEINLEGEQLVVKDRSTCNIARDYGQTTVYVTVPDGTLLPIIPELELHCKTEQKIQSEGILHSPIVRLFSLDDSDGAGTGDFRLDLQTEQLFIESNNVSNFYLLGFSENANISFYWGESIFYGDNLIINNTLIFYHRGSNDMIFRPINSLEGKIYSTGNVRLTNNPTTVNVTQYFTGRLIFE
jgi:hypothetical protein